MITKKHCAILPGSTDSVYITADLKKYRLNFSVGGKGEY